MPILKTPKELEGTAEEDEWSKRNQEFPFCWVSDKYDKVAEKIKGVSMLDGRYEKIVENVSLTEGDIKRMTRESRDEGKIFYIFHMPDISAISMGYFDINFVIANAMIIIMAGKRYLIIEKRRKENLDLKSLESIDFHFIKIKREEISELIESNTLKEVV